ncbi:1577_t:CDS:10 [Dentiscutata erythropus]|uniref:1577_t:CDS:1 n=1 Tax=Dentiscutata erythropus TaxID=1348616 RepID=A0A9N9D2C3_9GLOM|nr:1577_t:CDS:10 [Dentiscutata erythropus]
MNFDAFRNKLLSKPKYEFRVEVNQRCLIDKMLARYSSEFAVFRELLQNSDDAKSSAAKIVFMGTNGGTHSRMLFKNNGFVFRQQDWDRLKKIAEGNLDEQKIGAFGVGFYSVFSICEEPFVSSGKLGMAFHWKGDQLLVNHGPIDNSDTKWTTFLLDMREHLKFPDLDELGRFLATALGFTANLRKISVYFNEDRVIRISKEVNPPRPINIRSDINSESPKKMFKLESVNVQTVKFDAYKTVIPHGTVSLSNCLKKSATVCFQIASGNLKAQIDDNFSSEMERLTKKKPPGQTTIQIILPGYKDLEFSDVVDKKPLSKLISRLSTTKNKHTNIDDDFSCAFNYNSTDESFDIFKDLLPFPEQGRIFIGFRTHQTTGYSVNLAARVIPTVERESIDLAQKTLTIYNTEMLCLAGTLCRLLYEDEMNQISQLYQVESNNDKVMLKKRSAHALKHFTFNSSTPDIKVGNIIETQFYKCCSSPLSILSTHGVKAIKVVRLLNPEMATFIKTVPAVPKVIEDQCAEYFKRANTILKIIEKASISDVFEELKNRTRNQCEMSQNEMVALMNWWIIFRWRQQNFPKSVYDKLMQLAVVRIENKNVCLKVIRYFQNPEVIRPGLDIPPEVLPYAISKYFDGRELQKSFNWTELTLVTWTQYIIKKHNLKYDPVFAEKFINVLSQGFKSLEMKDRSTICQLLSEIECIPTQFGMKKPKESYFPDETLFSDLPNVSINVNEEFFTMLGIHKHVELERVFARLVNSKNLNHMKLLEYFTKRAGDLNDTNIDKLKKAPVWIKESAGNNKLEINARRYLARELYVPSDKNRDLELPVIQWEGDWNKHSEEAKFINMLGLQEYPSFQTIMKLMTDKSFSLRGKALKYFVNNFNKKYSIAYKPSLVQEKFLPCANSNVYAKPSECYSIPDCAKMGFNVLHQDWRLWAGQLGVKQHPDNLLLLNKLEQNPPRNTDDAERIFGYLATRSGYFLSSNWTRLQNIAFIPVQDEVSPYRTIYYKSKDCLFKSSKEIYADLFPCVDFGYDANKFLESCGVKREPSASDLAECLTRSSQKFWSNLNDKSQYIAILQTIANNYGSINYETLNKMRRYPILMGVKKHDKSPDIYYLASASNIFINDNDKYKDMFNPFTCPFDDKLELFYQDLGCQSLDASVTEEPQRIGIKKDSSISSAVKQRIMERIPGYYSSIINGKFRVDETWIQRLKVRVVDRIDMNYKLITTHQNQIKTAQASACISQNENSFILYITNDNNDINYADIATSLTKHIHEKPNRQNRINLFTYLTSSLENLRRLGYPTEKVKITAAAPSLPVSGKTLSPVAVPVPTNISYDELEKKLFNGINSCKSNGQKHVPRDNSPVIETTVPESHYESPLKYVKTLNSIEFHIPESLNPYNILNATMEKQLKCFIDVLIRQHPVF